VAPREGDAGLIGRITLLTDFGTADGYVAAMRGVIATRAPAIIVDDASHDIAAGDIDAAAAALSAYWHTYPPGTVHVAVVDPGVGTTRRPIVVTAAGRHGVGPDNGVLSPMLEAGGSAREIRASGLIREPRSATFHGRDIFAPTAAYLAAGGVAANVGPVVTDSVRLPVEAPARTPDGIVGSVVHIDRFGNLVTNVPAAWIEGAAKVEVDGCSAGPLRGTYGDVAPGAVVAVVGSGGCIEIAVRDGRAADIPGVDRGSAVRVSYRAISGPLR
jgi:S-adenosylmethionine hydrolase